MSPRTARRIRSGLERARFEVGLAAQLGNSVQSVIMRAQRGLDPDALAERAYWRELHATLARRAPRWHRRTWRAVAA